MSPVPEDLHWFCAVCGDRPSTTSDAVAHLEREHGQTPERWPDGVPVVDASDVPELITGREPA